MKFGDFFDPPLTNNQPFTLDAMKSMIDEANRRFPKRDLPKRIRAGGSVLLPIMTYATKKIGPGPTLVGLPIVFDAELELNCYAIEYADGEEELYDGNKLVCRRPIRHGKS